MEDIIVKRSKCKDCPFHINNILKYKDDIYNDIKEKNRGKLHKCHKIGDLCVGFIERAEELNELSQFKK